MNIKYCEPGAHQYDIWIIDEKKEIGIRKCKKCKHNEYLTLTDDIKNVVKKQKEATIFLKAFQKVTPEDKNAIDYTLLMLEDYLNYLSKEQAEALFLKIKSTIIDTKNQELIKELEKTYFDDYETFQDNLETFISNNQVQLKRQLY